MSRNFGTPYQMGALWAPSFDTTGGEPAGGTGQAPAAPAPAAPSASQPSGAAAGASPSNQPAPGLSGQPPAGAPEQEYEITVDGKKEKLTREQVIALAQQGKDYTKKTQTLAQQQQQFEQRVAQEVQRRQQAYLRQQAQQGKQPEGEEEELNEGQLALQRIQKFEEKQADEKLESVLNGITSKYPDLDADLILVHAQRRADQNGGALKWEDFDVVAKELSEKLEGSRSSFLEKALSDENHPLVKSTWEKRLQSYLDKKAEEAKKGGHLTGGGLPPGGAAPKAPPKDIREASDRALEQLQAANAARK